MSQVYYLHQTELHLCSYELYLCRLGYFFKLFKVVHRYVVEKGKAINTASARRVLHLSHCFVKFLKAVRSVGVNPFLQSRKLKKLTCLNSYNW